MAHKFASFHSGKNKRTVNEEKIKELLSVSFIRLIAERAGFVATKPSSDYGDDLYVKRLHFTPKFSKLQYFSTGELVGIQVKCVTQSRLAYTAQTIRFDLKEKPYNHLILRMEAWKKGGKIPLILVLVILPDDHTKWLNYDEKDAVLSLSSQAYWYLPDAKAKASPNRSTKRILISRENKINLNFFGEIFQKLHPI